MAAHTARRQARKLYERMGLFEPATPPEAMGAFDREYQTCMVACDEDVASVACN